MRKLALLLVLSLTIYSCTSIDEDVVLKEDIKTVLIQYVYENIDDQTAFNRIDIYCQQEGIEFTYAIFIYRQKYYYIRYKTNNNSNIIVTEINHVDKDNSCWSINNQQ